MAIETVDIRFRESGARVIKRKIDDIGHAANRATRGIFLFQRAMYVLGAAGLVHTLGSFSDALTNMENRLRLTSTSTENLEAVQSKLFDTARRARTDVVGLADVYNRMALSSRQLGASQEEVLRFTESLSKAATISGASAREANAALVQLGQGLASDRLSGDELRSVLEQLPFVADIIGRQLVKDGLIKGAIIKDGEAVDALTGKLFNTRGKLRELAKDGVVTAEVVFNAFQNAGDMIDAVFAQTNVTFGQAFLIAKTNLLQFMDSFEDATGLSDKLARAIIILSSHVDVLVAALMIAAGAVAALFAQKVVTAALGYADALRRAGGAALRMADIELLRARRIAKTTAAQRLALTQEQATLTTRGYLIAQEKARILQQARSIEFTIRNGRARNIETGMFVSAAVARENLAKASARLSALESLEQKNAARLAATRGALAAADNTAATASGRLAAAQAAQTATAGSLAARFPLLSGAVSGVATAFRVLWAVMLANPVTALLTIITTLVTAFILWGNEIKVTQDNVVGLRDYVVAAFEIMWESVNAFIGFVGQYLSPVWNTVSESVVFLGELTRSVIKTMIFAFVDFATFIPRVVVGTINGLIQAFIELRKNGSQSVDELINKAIVRFEDFANSGVDAINKVIEALNSLVSFIGAEAALEFFGIEGGVIKPINPVDLSKYKKDVEKAGGDIGKAFQDGFNAIYEGGKAENLLEAAKNALDPIHDEILKRARENIESRKGEITTGTRDPSGLGGLDSDGKGKKGRETDARTFEEIIQGLNREIEALKLSTREREISNGIIEIEKELKRGLTEEEHKLADATLRRLQAAEDQAELLEEIKGPQAEFNAQLAAANALMEQGRINADEYALALKRIQEQADLASNTIRGGFRAAISQSIMTATEFGQALGNIAVDGVNKLTDSILEFVQTGKFKIRELVSDILMQIARLLMQQAIMRLLGAIIGVPLGGSGLGSFGSSGTGNFGFTGISKALGFAEGGSFKVGGSGGTDSQLVTFWASPDERVTIETPAQQKERDRFEKQSMAQNAARKIDNLPRFAQGGTFKVSEFEKINNNNSSRMIDRMNTSDVKREVEKFSQKESSKLFNQNSDRVFEKNNSEVLTKLTTDRMNNSEVLKKESSKLFDKNSSRTSEKNNSSVSKVLERASETNNFKTLMNESTKFFNNNDRVFEKNNSEILKKESSRLFDRNSDRVFEKSSRTNSTSSLERVLPGFAEGGSFQVGGSGGTDSQIVAFKASPDERVTIETPEQQRMKENTVQAAKAPEVNVPVQIANVIDPAIVGNFIQTHEGKRLIVNIIRESGIVS